MTVQTAGHVDAVLSNISVDFSQGEGFVADKLFPVFPVKKESDVFYVMGREKFRPTATKRARGTVANTWKSGFTTDSYVCEEDALQGAVDDRDYANYDSPLDPEVEVVQGLTAVIQLGFEKEAAEIIRNPSTYPSSDLYGNPTAKFDTGGTSITMQRDIMVKARAVQSRIGKWPNTILIPPMVAMYMSLDDEITDLVKYIVNNAPLDSIPALIRGAQDSWLMPSVLWGMRVLVPSALEDTTKESQVSNATTDIKTPLTDIWGDDIWIGYCEPMPGLRKVSFGYTFEARPFQTKRWRNEEAESNMFRVSRISVRKVMCSAAGALLTDCLSTV